MLRASVVTLALALLASCVHRPVLAETGTSGRELAIRRCETALRSHFPNVFRIDGDGSRLRTDDRVDPDRVTRRTRAFVALQPGELGWAAEITIVKERLDYDEVDFFAPSARWVFDGRDRALERRIASEIEALGEEAASRP